MKKLFLLSSIGLSMVSVVNVYAKVDEAFLGYKLLAEKEKGVTFYTVKKAELLEFDTFQFTLKGTQEQQIKAVVAALIAPEETTNKNFKNQFSKDGEERLKELFKEAEVIEIEVLNDEEQDENDRYLVNVWLDGVLLQEILLSEGLAAFEEPEVEDYPYVQALWESQDYAQRYQVAMWESYSVANGTQGYTAPVGFSSNTNGNYSSNNAYSQSSSSQSSNQSYSQPVVTEAEVYVPEETVAPAASVYYPNCSAARAAGAAPVYAGEPGYGTHLDRDGDGIGCE